MNLSQSVSLQDFSFFSTVGKLEEYHFLEGHVDNIPPLHYSGKLEFL